MEAAPSFLCKFRETIDESKFSTHRTYHSNDLCNKCEGITFVITGKLSTFKNRDALVSYVERQGGKVTGSISKNTNYLVNNDVNSDSSKNKKAKELNIPIITEEEFVEKFGC